MGKNFRLRDLIYGYDLEKKKRKYTPMEKLTAYKDYVNANGGNVANTKQLIPYLAAGRPTRANLEPYLPKDGDDKNFSKYKDLGRAIVAALSNEGNAAAKL